MHSSKISKRQLFLMLAAARASVLVSGAFASVGAAPVVVVSLLVVTLCGLLRASVPEKLAAEIPRPYQKTQLLAAAVLGLVLVSEMIALRFFLDSFFEESVYQLPLILLAALLTVFYALKKGIEGAARFYFLAAVLGACMLAIVLLGNVSTFEAGRLLSPEIGMESFLKSFAAIALFPELLVLLVLAPFSREKVQVLDAVRFTQLQAAAFAMFCVLKEGVFGKAAEYLRFPFVELLSTGQFTFWGQMELLGTCVWTLLITVKLICITGAFYTLIRSKYCEKGDGFSYAIIAGCFALALIAAFCSGRLGERIINGLVGGSVAGLLVTLEVAWWRNADSLC